MNLKNQAVIHKSLGNGVIVEQDDKYITVEFASKTSKFMYQKRYDSLTYRFDTAKERLETVMAQLQQMQLQRADIEAFLQSFKKLPDTLTEFIAENWHALVDYATVYSTDDIRITFKHGQEIKS